MSVLGFFLLLFFLPPLNKRLFGLFQRGSLTQIPVVKETRVESGQFLLLSVLCMLFILVALAVSASFFCVRQRSHLRMKEKLASLGTDTSTDATATYQVRAPTSTQPFFLQRANQEADDWLALVTGPAARLFGCDWFRPVFSLLAVPSFIHFASYDGNYLSKILNVLCHWLEHIKSLFEGIILFSRPATS